MKTLTHEFSINEQLYALAYEMGIDTSATLEFGITDVVYKVHCTQQDYILLKKMAEELS
jgi:Ser/Thr protein kinase RdoA (MazF antagonist)